MGILQAHTTLSEFGKTIICYIIAPVDSVDADNQVSMHNAPSLYNFQGCLESKRFFLLQFDNIIRARHFFKYWTCFVAFTISLSDYKIYSIYRKKYI